MPRITKDHCQVTKPHCCGLHHFTSCQVIQLFQNRLFGIRSFFSGNSPNHNNKLSSKEEQDHSPRQAVAVMISRWQDRIHRVLGARGSRCLPASKTGPGLPPVRPHRPLVMQLLFLRSTSVLLETPPSHIVSSGQTREKQQKVNKDLNFNAAKVGCLSFVTICHPGLNLANAAMTNI